MNTDLINVWLGVTEDYRNEILEYIAWDEETQGTYPGPLVATDEAIFSTMQDMVTRQAFFRVDGFQGKSWYLFTVTIKEMELDDVTDWLAANKGSKTKILGAWYWDNGLQHGTELDEGTVIGTPTYPLNNRILKFMPDIIEYDEDGNIVSTTPASEMTDVNLEQGQAPRVFQ